MRCRQAPSRFVLVAHSMGGRVALEIMRTGAARVSALALLDTGYQARAPGPDAAREARGRQALLEIASSKACGPWAACGLRERWCRRPGSPIRR